MSTSSAGKGDKHNEQTDGKWMKRQIFTSGGWAPGAGLSLLWKAVLDAWWMLPGCVDVGLTGRGGETIQLAHGRVSQHSDGWDTSPAETSARLLWLTPQGGESMTLQQDGQIDRCSGLLCCLVFVNVGRKCKKAGEGRSSEGGVGRS